MRSTAAINILVVSLVVALIGYSEWIVRPHYRDGRTHIVYWEKWTNFEGDAIRDTVDYFNNSQNKIFVELLTVNKIEDKVLLSTAGGDPPDVAGLYAPQVAQYNDDYALMPLNDFCKEAGIDASQYIPAYWECCNIDGKIIVLPTTPADTALHISKKAFAEAGLDPDRPPKTIEEFDKMCDKLTKKLPDGRIDKAGFIPSEPDWWNWSWGSVFGGKLWDGKGKILANSKENVRAYDWVASFARRYGGNNVQAFKSGLGKFAAPENGFFTGKIATVVQGVWMHNFIKKYGNHLNVPTRQWYVAPFPYPADRPDLVNNTVVDLDVIGIPKGSKHPREAFEFIKFLQSQKGSEMLNLKHGKHTPLLQHSPGYFEHHPNPDVKLFADLANSKNAFSPPKMAIWPEYKDALSAMFDEVILGRKSAQQALDEVQARMQPLLNQYIKRKRQRGEL